ncbi:MAG: phospholipid carrier-dependent glycosyltransferase, partial [Armatimonadetes bacterium]|nr:phospholipid carrier-dependent glycosyltransferase [Armatimonadota bacterium]
MRDSRKPADLASQHAASEPAHQGPPVGPSAAQVAWALFTVALLAYALTAKGFWDLNDAEAYYLVTKSLVERGRVDVKPEIIPASEALYITGSDGRLYVHFGVGQPLFLAPLYFVGKGLAVVGEWVAPRWASVADYLPRVTMAFGYALAAAGSVALVYLLLVALGVGARWAVATALLYGFTTYVWPYSKIGFYDIQLTFFHLLAVLAVVQYRRLRGASWVFLSAWALGWAVAIRATAALSAPFLFLYILWGACDRTEGDGPGLSVRISRSLKPALVFL